MRTLTDTRPWNIPAEFPLTQGKVRDVYDLGDELLIIATDRLSAFDVVLQESPIPGRGIVLTQMTIHWLNVLKDASASVNSPIPVVHHLVSTDVADLPDAFQPFAADLEGRFMLVNTCEALWIEMIVRGFISGSLWKEYASASATGPVVLLSGHELPVGLVESQEFPQAIFTPSTKAPQGEHDINISYDEMVESLRSGLAERDIDLDAETLAAACRDLSLTLYTAGRDYARERGIIIADTKFEFGLRLIDDIWHLVIIDEVLTPDSSRFWPADEYEAGRSQNSFDKQIVRDYLAKNLKWNKQPPVPVLPAEIIEKTASRYHDCAEKLGIELSALRLNVTVLFGSKNDLDEDMRKAIRDAREAWCFDGPFHTIDVHVMSVHRNTPICIALAANELEGVSLDDIDIIIAAAGWANQLAGMMAAFLHHNGRKIPVIGLAIGTPGTKEFDAARLSIECLPGKPVILDPSGNAYANATGMRDIFLRLATEPLPQAKPYVEKPVELYVEID